VGFLISKEFLSPKKPGEARDKHRLVNKKLTLCCQPHHEPKWLLESAMFELLAVFIVCSLLITLGSGLAPVILHRMFGPALPPSIQQLADTFTIVFKAGATMFLGPVELIKRLRLTVSPPSNNLPSRPHETPSLSPSDTKQITEK
jgi:hypothetical protein